MSDEMAAFEQDLGSEDQVYGDHDQIAESLNAFISLAGVFGKDEQDKLVAFIDGAVPLLGEINAKRPASMDELEGFVKHYFGTPEMEAKTVDAMAEGVKVAQRWLVDWMQAHDLKVISVYLPDMEGHIRSWTFGRLSDVQAQLDPAVLRDGRLGSVTAAEKPQDPPDTLPGPGGYL